MKRRLRALGAGLLIAGSLFPAMALAPAPVLATTPVIDQYQLSIPWEYYLTGWNTQSDYAQTFTVGKTGTLMTVALWLFSNGHVTVDVYIFPLNASGHPAGSALSSGYASVGTTDGFFLFAMQPAYFTAGQRLAIVIHPVVASPPSTHYDLLCRYSNTNSYTRGMALEYGNTGWRPFQFETFDDFAFKTYVVLPTPTLAPPIFATQHVTAPPTPVAATPHPTLIASASPELTATPTASSTEAPAATETPVAAGSAAATGSSEIAGAFGSAAATTSASAPPGSAVSGGANDAPLPAILAAITALIVAGGGVVFFFLVRRRRKPEAAQGD